MAIHPTADVESPELVGDRTQIWHFCHLMRGARVGSDCILGQNVFIDRDVTIGDRVKIQNNVSVYWGVTVEDDVFLGPSCVFTNVKNPRSAFPADVEDYDRTLIGRGATIGANATIVCGVTIGEGAFIGAGSVVTRSVGAYELVVGSPARPVGMVCICGERLLGDDGCRADRCSCPKDPR